jgi:hypothetical protein
MICAFCGLETGSPTAHETQQACLEALRFQVSALRSALRYSRRCDEPPIVPEEALSHAGAGAPPSK